MCAGPLTSPFPARGPAAGFEAAGTRAVQAAMAGLPGPVQVNVPFDEPLVEPPADHPGAYLPPAGDLSLPQFPVPASPLDRIAGLLRSARRPLIIAGPETGGLPVGALLRLADSLGAPILADPLSGLRAGVPDGAPVLDAFDAWFRSVPPPPPDFVLRFGASPTSKVLNQLLAGWSDAVHVLVDLPGGYREPNGTRPLVLMGSPAAAAEALAAVPAQAEGRWRGRLLEADRAARAALDAASREPCEPFEGRVFTELRDLLPPGATLVAGNSMPVRDLDNFFGLRQEPLDITANRGANGIDGVMSSAAGAAAAGTPTAVVVGDVSFLHDLNALWAAREHRLPLLVVVVNNGGGGIFHYLPQVAHTDAFERWFATPPGIEPARAAALFDLPFCRAESWPAFCEAVESWVQAPGPFVVEVRTDRRANVAMHQRAWAAAARAAAEVLGR
ncbi:MAG: hypothetical protein KatS3mg063_1254 [Tepidiforma sp.]|nr:MAG: hypothetical protein KatS3mg063_1254 [Tepidiforma sp.]